MHEYFRSSCSGSSRVQAGSRLLWSVGIPAVRGQVDLGLSRRASELPPQTLTHTSPPPVEAPSHTTCYFVSCIFLCGWWGGGVSVISSERFSGLPFTCGLYILSAVQRQSVAGGDGYGVITYVPHQLPPSFCIGAGCPKKEVRVTFKTLGHALQCRSGSCSLCL